VAASKSEVICLGFITKFFKALTGKQACGLQHHLGMNDGKEKEKDANVQST